MDMNVVVGTLLNLFSLLIFGYFLHKIKIIDHEANLKISNLIINVTAPLLVVSSVKGSSIHDGGGSTVWTILAAGTVFFIVAPILARLIVIPFHLDTKKSHVYQLLFIYTNLGFMGFPVVRSIYGQQGLFLMGILNMCFGIAAFSHGVYILQKDSKGSEGFSLKKLINPGIIASSAALVIYMTGLPIPDAVMDWTKIVGEVTVPLSMMIIGASLAEVPVGKLFQFKSLYLMSLICMIVEPWLVYKVMSLFTDDTLAVGIVTLAAAMPAAALVSILCNKYQVEEDIASTGVFITTLLSLATIPLIVSWLLV